jgi:membrane-associated protease RseP (regulator of RpoE activity)
MNLRQWLISGVLLALSAAGVHAQRTDVRTEARTRGWLGISYSEAAGVRGGRTPLVITEVVESSPAERAGLMRGDTLLRINNLNATQEFMATLGSALGPGDTVQVRVRRGGQTRDFSVVAAERPAQYAVLPRNSRVVVVDPDSLRGKLRIMIDSVMTRIDSLDVPRVYIQSGGPEGMIRYRLFTGDSVFRFGPDSMRIRVRPFAWDSMRMRIDTVWQRMLPRVQGFTLRGDSTFRFWTDSIIRLRGDSAWTGFYGNWQVWPGDSAGPSFVFGRGFPGVAVLGVRAIAGAELTELSPGLADYFGVEEGVLVVRVPEGTPADRTGLEEGDVIVSANGQDVSNVSELRRVIMRTDSSRPVQLELVRKNRRMTLELRRE